MYDADPSDTYEFLRMTAWGGASVGRGGTRVTKARAPHASSHAKPTHKGAKHAKHAAKSAAAHHAAIGPHLHAPAARSHPANAGRHAPAGHPSPGGHPPPPSPSPGGPPVPNGSPGQHWGGWAGRGDAGWGGPYAWGPSFVIACGDGSIALADGTCVDPSRLPPEIYATLGDAGEMHPTVGAALPRQTPGARAVHVLVGDDGLVRLPDGTVVDSGELKWASVGASRTPPVGTPPGTPSVPDYSMWQSGNSLDTSLDTINNVWAGLNVAATQCLAHGLNSDQYAQFAQDFLEWGQQYNAMKASDSSSLFGSYGYNSAWWGTTAMNTYMQKAAQWEATMQPLCPSQSFPNLPPPEGPSPIIATANAISSALQWGVIALLVGVGVWFLWPVISGGHAAAAAAAA